MDPIVVIAFVIIMTFSFASAIIYYITYPKDYKRETIAINLPNNSDCSIEKAILDFDINVEEEIQDVELDKL